MLRRWTLPTPALLLALGAAAAPQAAGAAAATPVAAAPVLVTPVGSGSVATLPLVTLDPELYRVVRRPSPSTVVVHYPATSHCATTTLRLSTVRDRRDPTTWLRENTPPSDLAFETQTTATVPALNGLSTETTVVGASRLFAGVLNSSILTERAVAAARLRSGRLAILSQTSRTIDLGKHPGTACGGTGSFSTGPAFAALRTSLVGAVHLVRAR